MEPVPGGPAPVGPTSAVPVVLGVVLAVGVAAALVAIVFVQQVRAARRAGPATWTATARWCVGCFACAFLLPLVAAWGTGDLGSWLWLLTPVGVVACTASARQGILVAAAALPGSFLAVDLIGRAYAAQADPCSGCIREGISPALPALVVAFWSVVLAFGVALAAHLVRVRRLRGSPPPGVRPGEGPA